MPKPLSICIEDLGAANEEERYTRCVALPGGQPGLGLDPAGHVLWQTGCPVACELWISADDKLILRRPDGAPVVRVSRLGRSIEAPFGKPVVLLDQDEIDVSGRGFRVHVHGEAQAVHPPTPLRQKLKRAAGIAAAVALSAAPVAASEPVEVRDHPPKPAPDYRAPPPVPPATEKPDAGTPAPKPDAGPSPTIEVRPKPPEPMPMPPAKKK